MSSDVQGSESLEDLLSLSEAGRLSGLSPHTLAQQAERGRLRARKVGGTWITTHQWLEEYLVKHSRRRRASATE